MDTKLLTDSIRYVKAELAKKAGDDKPLTVWDLHEAFSDLEHAVDQLATGEYHVDSWGKLERETK